MSDERAASQLDWSRRPGSLKLIKPFHALSTAPPSPNASRWIWCIQTSEPRDMFSSPWAVLNSSKGGFRWKGFQRDSAIPYSSFSAYTKGTKMRCGEEINERGVTISQVYDTFLQVRIWKSFWNENRNIVTCGFGGGLCEQVINCKRFSSHVFVPILEPIYFLRTCLSDSGHAQMNVHLQQVFMPQINRALLSHCLLM